MTPDARAMNSRPEDTAHTPPGDVEPQLTNTLRDEDESDSVDYVDLPELLSEWSGDLGDALALDDLLTDVAKTRALDEVLSIDPGSQPKPGSRRRRARANTLSTRAKRAIAIARLQKESTDLYEMLLALREKVKAAGSVRNRLPGGPWEVEADRQRELLSLAESVNSDLKSEVEVQKREARSLHRVLSKRIADAKLLRRTLHSPTTRAPKPLPPVFSDTHMVFARLLAETEAMHSKTDVMLQHLRSKVSFPVENGSFREWKATYRPSGTAKEDTAFVEMIDIEELPFSVPHVHHAIENFNASDDTIMSTSFFTYDQGDETVHVRLRQVVQHFVADTYAVFVSTFIVDSLTKTWAPSPNGLLKKVQEWRIVSASDEGTTLHQTIAILVPEFSRQSLLDPSHPTFGKRLVMQQIDMWLASFEHTTRKIENLLMNPSLTPKERCSRR